MAPLPVTVESVKVKFGIPDPKHVMSSWWSLESREGGHTKTINQPRVSWLKNIPSHGIIMESNEGFFGTLLYLIPKRVPSLKLTVKAPENRPKPNRKVIFKTILF